MPTLISPHRPQTSDGVKHYGFRQGPLSPQSLGADQAFDTPLRTGESAKALKYSKRYGSTQLGPPRLFVDQLQEEKMACHRKIVELNQRIEKHQVTRPRKRRCISSVKASEAMEQFRKGMRIKLPNKADTKRTSKLRKAIESPYYHTLTDFIATTNSTRCAREAAQ
jgi:hypothetical protein